MELAEGFRARTAIVIGSEGLEKLAAARVCVFGLGGVGAACALDLVRVGIGRLVVCDFDTVQESNLNRLAIGYAEFIGKSKALAFREMALRINPSVEIEIREDFLTGSGAVAAIPSPCGFYIDCIDTLNSKVNLIAALARSKLPFIASMGTGGRLEPERLAIGNLWDSAGCPLARAVRQRLPRLGIGRDTPIPCVWSDETPAEPGPAYPIADGDGNETERQRRVQGSAPFVPQAAGHLLASYATRYLLGRLS